MFDTDFVDPSLDGIETLEEFRPGCHLIEIGYNVIDSLGLLVTAVPGVSHLPQRLRVADREIQPRTGISTSEFKSRLKELERHVR